ncbi:MAG: hypothetical protein IH594_10825, partial [Bacteroidales bacterium]|nr:hypothetical protein [Bacteroidales bacterium]
MKKLNKTSLFLLLTLGISFTGAGLFRLLGGQYSGIQGTLLASIYMFVPALSAFIALAIITTLFFIYDRYI